MKNYNRIIKIILLILAVSFVITGCNKNSKHPVINEPTSSPDEKNVTPVPTFQLDMTTLRIYTIQQGTEKIVPVTALITEEITPEIIVDNVIESMEDASYYIEVTSVTTDQDAVIISFSDQSPPCANVSKAVETTILDAFAQSLLDNLTDYCKVIYRTNDEAYKSKYNSFQYNYVYLENKN